MKKAKSPVATDTILEDLVIAILAVNNYPLDKAFGLRDKLLAAGWFDPAKVARLSHDEAIARLTAAGYDRGPTMNSIFASRLQELGQYVVREGLDALKAAVAAKDQAVAGSILKHMHGVGPVVIGNFWTLQDQG